MSNFKYRKVNKMSKAETSNSTSVIKKVYKYFDLDTLANKEEEKTIEFSPAGTFDEAMTRIGNDPNVVLNAINALLRAEALAKAETEVISKGGKRSVVLSIMKPLRAMPPYNSYFVLDSDGKKTFRTRKTRTGETVTEPVMDKDRQDKEILALLKSSPAMLESVKKASLEAIGSDEDENDENE